MLALSNADTKTLESSASRNQNQSPTTLGAMINTAQTNWNPHRNPHNADRTERTRRKPPGDSMSLLFVVFTLSTAFVNLLLHQWLWPALCAVVQFWIRVWNLERNDERIPDVVSANDDSSGVDDGDKSSIDTVDIDDPSQVSCETCRCPLSRDEMTQTKKRFASKGRLKVFCRVKRAFKRLKKVFRRGRICRSEGEATYADVTQFHAVGEDRASSSERMEAKKLVLDQPRPLISPDLRHNDYSFISTSDLDMQICSGGREPSSFRKENFEDPALPSIEQLTSSSHLASTTNDFPSIEKAQTRDFSCIDDNVCEVIEALFQHAFNMVTEESERFVPVQHTDRLLANTSTTSQEALYQQSWQMKPWSHAVGSDVLVWVGDIGDACYGRFKSIDIPIIKARGLVPASPREVIDLLMDSSRVCEYNKMSQGREDLVVLQEGIDSQAENSLFGLAGEAKIVRSLNKIPLLRRCTEVVSLVCARLLTGFENTYVAVSRSVWENATGTPEGARDVFRTEIILGATLVRPVPGPDGEQHCELTTITQAYSHVVPSAIARRAAPSHAAKFIKAIQAVFS